MARRSIFTLLLGATLQAGWLAGCGDPSSRSTPSTGGPAPRSEASAALLSTSAAAPVALDDVVGDFRNFVLNALLLPLLDDDLPLRWADPSFTVECEAAEVLVDGVRPTVGAPVPQQAFTLRWRMQRCSPMSGYFELSGEVELQVQPVAGGYTASVQPKALQFVSAAGAATLREAFEARMSTHH